jgi:hypothetical protein
MNNPLNILSILGVFVLASAWCTARSADCKEHAEIERDPYKQGILYKHSKQYGIASAVIIVLGCLVTGLLILI